MGRVQNNLFRFFEGKGGDIVHKKFNVTGYCNPDRNYMVDLTERLNTIRNMIDEGIKNL